MSNVAALSLAVGCLLVILGVLFSGRGPEGEQPLPGPAGERFWARWLGALMVLLMLAWSVLFTLVFYYGLVRLILALWNRAAGS